IGILFGNRNRISIGRTAGGYRNVSATGDDAIKCAAVDDEIFNDRKCPGAPRLEVKHVAVLEVAHMELADRCRGLRTVSDSVDHEAARTADSFTAVVIESDWLFALRHQIFVEHVEHLQK